MKCDRVIAANRQLGIAVLQQATPQQARFHLEIFAAKPSFDCNLRLAALKMSSLLLSFINLWADRESRLGCPAVYRSR